jgi:beta-lactamase regulating signal transducer with metallopeptidase domain
VHFLLNWLWQGCVVAFATVAVLRVVRRLTAPARYYIWWAALCFVIALPVIPSITSSPASVLAIRGPDRILPVVSLPDTSWAINSIAVILWCAWIAVHMAHIAVAAVALRRAEARSQPFPSAIETRLRHWGRIKERGRRTRLLISDGVHSAAVLGVVAPRIAIAPALLEQLNEDDLDRVVAHEWAHVQRHDDLANLIQLLVRSIVGWHPAVWWIDRQLRLEREVACDDTAVLITGSPKGYAAALAKLASLLPARVAALPVPGALSSSGIGTRIVRILSPRAATSTGWTLTAATAATASLLAISWWVAGFALVQVARRPVAAVATTERVRAVVTRSESGRAPAEAVARRTARRGAVAPMRGMADSGRQATPAERAPDPPTVESILSDNGSRNSSSVDPPPLPAVALSGPTAQGHLSFAPALLERPLVQSDGAAPQVAGARPPSPWSTAADAGVAVGRSSKNAAVATAGMFSRFSKKIAGSF